MTLFSLAMHDWSQWHPWLRKTWLKNYQPQKKSFDDKFINARTTWWKYDTIIDKKWNDHVAMGVGVWRHITIMKLRMKIDCVTFD